ncbi:unnamed protein product, partial [Polarella glacialis]
QCGLQVSPAVVSSRWRRREPQQTGRLLRLCQWNYWRLYLALGLVSEGISLAADSPDYSILAYLLPTGTVEQLVTIVPVGRFDGKLLVAIPHVFWNRVAKKRHILSQHFTKPIALEVAIRSEEDTEAATSANTKIWMGVLTNDAERQLFVPFDVDSLGFQFASTVPMEGARFPLGKALNDAAAEHYTFMSAPSEDGKEFGIATPPGLEGRLERLEGTLESIQNALVRLSAEPGKPPKQAVLKPAAKAAGAKRAEVAQKADAAAVPGLAPGLVRAARASGIDEATLEAMSVLMKKAPPRLGEQPAAKTRTGPFQLTKLVTMLASEKDSGKAVSKLDRALEGISHSGTGSTEAGAPSGASRRSAAALRALRLALSDEPEQIYRPIERAMGEQIRAQTELPGVHMAADSRVWLEHRSHVQSYPATIRWMWAIAGIHSCLKDKKYEEARARIALLLAAGEQFSMDGGSWLLAAEILMEQPPPFSSFARRQLPEPSELQHSSLIDPRWIEAIMAKLKEAEDFQERRKRLQRLPTGGKPKGEGEPLAAQRGHLLLPQDLLQSNLDHFYIKVEKPKTRKRGGAKVQHSKIVGVDVVAFVVAVFASLPRSEKLYPGTASHYRRRWDAILKALEVPPCLKLTPGGLRGGGAVAAYRHGTPVSDILWRMRIKHMQTLESYLQEVAAESIIPSLPVQSRVLVAAAAKLWPLSVSHVVSSRSVAV